MTTTRRNSRQRTLVYQVVKDSHSHPNAEEVYLLVRRQLPDISLGTVYRNLNLLVEMGLLHRIYTGMGADRFDAVVTAHPHLICSSCGGVFDLECQVERETAQLKQAFERSGATIDEVQVRAWGICDRCKQDHQKENEHKPQI